MKQLLAYTDSRYNGKQNLDFIYPDLAKALLPVIDKFVEKARTNEIKYRREQLILGLLNLYGILGFRELEERPPQLIMGPNARKAGITFW